MTTTDTTEFELGCFHIRYNVFLAGGYRGYAFTLWQDLKTPETSADVFHLTLLDTMTGYQSPHIDLELCPHSRNVVSTEMSVKDTIKVLLDARIDAPKNARMRI